MDVNRSRGGSPRWVALLCSALAACSGAPPEDGVPPLASDVAEDVQAVGGCSAALDGGFALGPAIAMPVNAGELLPSGKILMVAYPYQGTPSAEIFDPATGVSTPIAAPPITVSVPQLDRAGAHIVLSDYYPNSSVAVFDEALGSWTAGSILVGAWNRGRVPLPSGELAFIAGYNAAGSSEIFDPATMTSTFISTLPVPLWEDEYVGAALPSGDFVALSVYGTGFEYNRSSDTWTALPSSYLYYPAVQALPNGDILFVDPTGNPGQRFDLATHSLVGIAPLPAYQEGAKANLLSTGEVLVAGGLDLWNTGQPFSTTYVYDPALDTWTAGPSLHVAKSGVVQELLPDGRVFIAGGGSGYFGTISEYFHACANAGADTDGDGVGDGLDNCVSDVNPTQGDGDFDGLGDACDSCTEFGDIPPNSAYRYAARTVALPDGRGMIIGGEAQYGPIYYTDFSAADIFDPSTDTWTTTSMAFARAGHEATLLADGRVFVSGASDFTGSLAQIQTTIVEAFDPTTNTWSNLAPSPVKRTAHQQTQLADGRVLVTAGAYTESYPEVVHSTAHLYDPASNSWSPTGNLATPRVLHTAVRLADGRVLVAGGRSKLYSAGVTYASSELYDPATGTFSPGPTMTTPRVGAHAYMLPTGQVIFIGGGPGTDIFDPVTNTFSAGPNTNSPRSGEGAVTTCGLVLLTGGTQTYEVLDPATLTFTEYPNPFQGGFSPVALGDGRAILFGGVVDTFNPYLNNPKDATLDVCCGVIADGDGDGIDDASDNCVATPNATQDDVDADGFGDVCDNCPTAANASQSDGDADGVGNACDPVCLTIKRGLSGTVEDAAIATNPLDPTLASANFGVVATMPVGTVGLSHRMGLYQFDTASIPTDATVTSATLRLYQALRVGTSFVTLHPVTAPWTEASVTASSFANAFDSSTVSATYQPSSQPAGSFVSLDIAPLVQAWVSGVNYGLLVDQAGYSRVVYAGSEAPSALRPKLDLCYVTP